MVKHFKSNRGLKSVLVLLFCFFALPLAVTAYDFDASSGLANTGGKAGYSTDNDPRANLPDTIGSYVNVVISFVGVIFLVLAIYAGFMWMSARGNDAEVAAAKKILERAIIGLVVVLAAYVITYFVSQIIFSSTVKGS